MKNVLTVIFCALLLVGGQPLRGHTPPTGFTSTIVSSGWNEAVGLAFNSTGSKMFVWERPGKVWVVVSTGDGAHWAPDLGSYNETYYAEVLADGIISAKEDVGALRAQLVDCLSGKILRLDPATGNGVPSNPFYDAASPGAPRSRMWPLDLRTPFRMSLRLGTSNSDPTRGNPGPLYLGMVGTST